METKMNLLTPSKTYKPFRYPWAFDAWKQQQQIHWLPEEVPMADDVADWKHRLTDQEKNLLTQIFRFFVQGDVEVADCYHTKYLNRFGPTEVRMMLSAFASMETVHIAAYSHLLDTLGMPETEYEAFLHYEEMKSKADYLHQFNSDTDEALALTMAAFGAFMEGLQLFASFAILLNFPRFNRMKGMGQIITWSVRDETLHCNSIIKLFRTFLSEKPELDTPELRAKIEKIALEMVEHEDAFIDRAFELGAVKGMTPEDVKAYIRYIADRRLIQLGYKGIFGLKDNPIPWLEEQLNAVEHANFFEQRATEYSKASTKGTWDDVWGEVEASRQPAPFIVYSKSGCPACVMAENLLKRKGLAYEKVDVTNDMIRQALYEKTRMRTVPVIMQGDTLIGGYEQLAKHLA